MPKVKYLKQRSRSQYNAESNFLIVDPPFPKKYYDRTI